MKSGGWAKDESGLTTEDELRTLISMADADRLATTGLTPDDEALMGEGDIDYEKILAERGWSIQTGAYRDLELAQNEMNSTKPVVTDVARIAINEISETTSAGKQVFRIRFNGLTEDEARAACDAVIDGGGDCFALRNPALSKS